MKLGYKNVYRFAEGLPKWKEMGLPLAEGPSSPLTDKHDVTPPYGMGLLLTLLGVFIGGIGLNLTPCVYPLIPITASYFGGRTETGGRQGVLLVHGMLYILGLSVMNSALGVSAAFTGKLMGSLLQHPAVLIFVSAVMFFMALNFFGFWELRLPALLTSTVSKTRTGYAQSLFMGLTLGIVAAPCIGPFVIGLLTMVAQKGSPMFGLLIFFTLSIGLGLPLFVLSLFAGNLNKLPRSGEWMVWIRNLFGWIMLAMAVYFIKPLFLRDNLGTYMLALVLLAGGLHLGFINKSGANVRTFANIKKIFGVLAVASALAMTASAVSRGPGVSWHPYSREFFSRAVTSQKPIILDFYADWCTPCRQLSDKTFHHAAVVKESGNFTMIKVDLTRESDPDVMELVRKYEVRGVPTVLFLDSRGNELKALQTVDFVPGDEFLLRMKKALES